MISRALQARIEETERTYKSLCKERQEMEVALKTKALGDEEFDAAIKLREEIMIGIENATFEDKRAVIEALRVNVVVLGTRAVISCRIPMQENAFDLGIRPDATDNIRW